MKINTHTQVRISKAGSEQTVWIESNLAVVGKYLKLKTDNGWDDGWRVDESYETAVIDSVFIRERGSDYKNMRRMTDI